MRNVAAVILRDYLTDLVIAMGVILMNITQQAVRLVQEESVLWMIKTVKVGVRSEGNASPIVNTGTGNRLYDDLVKFLANTGIEITGNPVKDCIVSR